MRSTKYFRSTLMIMGLMLMILVNINQTSASVSGYAQFTKIRVKDHDSFGDSEFQLQFKCIDSDGDWRIVQTSLYQYDINPTGYETFFGNTREDGGTSQTLYAASYEPFSSAMTKRVMT